MYEERDKLISETPVQPREPERVSDEDCPMKGLCNRMHEWDRTTSSQLPPVHQDSNAKRALLLYTVSAHSCTSVRGSDACSTTSFCITQSLKRKPSRQSKKISPTNKDRTPSHSVHPFSLRYCMKMPFPPPKSRMESVFTKPARSRRFRSLPIVTLAKKIEPSLV